MSTQPAPSNATPPSPEVARTSRRTVGRLRKILIGLLALFVFVVGWYLIGRLTSPWRKVVIISPAHQLPPAAIDTSRPLRIVAYNIAHGRGLADTNWAGDRRDRLTQIAEMLKSQNADVVVLNEVDHDATWSGRQSQAAFIAERAGYPYRAEQTNYDLSLPGLRIRFGNALLSRVPISDAKAVHYASPSRIETLAYGQKDGLICTLHLGEGKRVRILAVHLESRFEPTRVETVPMLKALMNDPSAPLILAGDFNSVVDAPDQPRPALDMLLNQTKLGRPTGELNGTYPSESPQIHIDHILAEPPWQVVTRGVIDSQLSDHRPIWAELAPTGAQP